jgi:hypothetical protein
MTPGPLFCPSCLSTELLDSTPSRCAHCGSHRILEVGSVRAAVICRRGKLRDALAEAVKRLLLESGASWPGKEA